MKYVHRFSLLIGLLGLCACSSNPIKDFENVREGMPKYDVLEAMGVPQRTQRWQGKDRWTYLYVESEKTQTKEVHFQEGKVVYKGDPIEPAISAEAQDQKNEISNAELEKQYAEKRAAIRNQQIDSAKDTGSAMDSEARTPRYEPID